MGMQFGSSRGAQCATKRAPAHGWIGKRADGAAGLGQAVVEDRHRAVGQVGDSDVGLAVAVQVSDGHGPRLTTGRQLLRWVECAVAAAEQDPHLVAARVGHDQIQLAVAVDVPVNKKVYTVAGQLNYSG